MLNSRRMSAARSQPHVLAPPRSTRRSLFVVAMLALLHVSSGAHAQSRFALEVGAGLAVPLNPPVQHTVVLDTDGDAESVEIGTPRLTERLAWPGLNLRLTAHVATLEIRYDFERFGWRGARALCVGDRQARRLPSGEVDDLEVRYRCGGPGERVDLQGDSAAAIRFHHVSAGPRFYLRRRDGRVDRARVYGVATGGITLARYRDPNLGELLRAGFNTGGGGGVDFPLDRRLTLALDLRYAVSIVAGSSSTSARSGRAIATGRNVVSALTDVYHRVTLNVGIRLGFR